MVLLCPRVSWLVAKSHLELCPISKSTESWLLIYEMGIIIITLQGCENKVKIPKINRQKQNGSLISDSASGHYDWGHFKLESLAPVTLPDFMPRPCWIGPHWLSSRREGSLAQGKDMGIGWVGANPGFATSKWHRWAIGNLVKVL